MIVMKFGGTSVSSKQNIEQLKSVLLKKKENYIVVVSAFSTITNKLEEIARLALADNSAALQEEFKSIHFKLIEALFPLANQTELFMLVQQKCNEIENICASIYTLNELSFKTQAHIVSYGEQMSSFILYKYLNQEGIEIECLDSRELIIANNSYLNADVDFELTEKNISQKIEAKNYIAGGFIASNPKQETVTLGRGGSDYSAAIFASAIEADFLEIWSDVNGIHSANPNIVKNTISIKELSYEEAFELAYFGAKVLYPPTILPIMNKNIPLYLKNMLYPEQEGTYIGNSDKEREHKIQGVSSLSNIIILTVSGVGLARKQGSARRVFQALEEQNINIILITQSCSEQSIGIGIKKDHLEDAKDAIHQMFSHEISNGLINKVSVTEEQSIIALVGDNMKNKVGLSGKIFGAIGENGINITAIAQGASERNISIVVHQDDEEKAIHVIHEKFFNNVVKNVHLFIAGVGNVGDEFLNILEAQKEKLIKEHQINLKIIGVANSSKMLFGKDELDNAQIRSLKEDGVAYDSFGDFLSRISDLNLRNSIFIDNTASDIVSKGYSHLLEKSISVVTCNKIACSGDYSMYAQLLKSAKEYNCHFKYETSVGAALPIIKTIHDLIISGDKIKKIEAVISGSLNFIFNEYNGEKEFYEVVLKAKEEGYTEPNPLIDLSGLDVMRKILILSRESGLNRELDDISFKSFLPESCLNAPGVDALFEELKKTESHFKSLYENARDNGNKLKVLASLEHGKMSVELKEIPSHSPFYNLEGKDNVITINTERYTEEPLMIKGAGAGALVTASGVFADLMFIVNR